MILGASAQMMISEMGFNECSEFLITFVDYEIGELYCQLQLRLSRRAGFAECLVDWGDGTVDRVTETQFFHNYTKVGTYRVRIGPEARWWRLWECYTAQSLGYGIRYLYSRPKIVPLCWSDTLESCSGTYCGWSDSHHGGVVGSPIPWGRAVTSTFCCYQFCRDLTGLATWWTRSIVDATGTYDGCVNLRSYIPDWGPDIVRVSQCYQGCTGLYGRIPKWPERCLEMSYCYSGCSGLEGEVPAWPSTGVNLDFVFDGCSGLRGRIPRWPNTAVDVSGCYRDCIGLTDAWTHVPQLLMPEEQFRHPEARDWYRCEQTVKGCSDALRSLFWDRYWGGLIPHP